MTKQKLLGLIGGVSPQSTAVYYRLLNEHARARLGGEHSANALLYALDYGEMIGCYNNADWPGFTQRVVAAGQALKAGGAEALVITSNTTHLAADAVAEATGLPLVHLMDALTEAMNARNVKKPLLLGTPVVMTGEHYLPALAERYEGAPVIPDAEECKEIGRIILEELVEGVVLDASRRALLDIVERHAKAGADGVILGCTELCLILAQEHTPHPVFDTTALHAKAASDYAFGIRGD